VARFPDGKRFAFTVFDDTDAGTLANLRPVYGLLAELGLRTTKSVWSLPCDPAQPQAGQTLADPDYRAWLYELQAQGFEIGWHGTSNFSQQRDGVEHGLAAFADALGGPPRTYANHMGNRENVYWGSPRLSPGLPRLVYDLVTRGKRRCQFTGHVPGDQRYWGDICRRLGCYVRNFVFDEINLDKVNPTLPYFDPDKPDVAQWFSSCEGGDCRAFCAMLSPSSLQRLEDEGGVCIMYTHFAKGFMQDGALDGEFRSCLADVAARPGWFVPVSTLLDYLLARRAIVQPGHSGRIPPAELRRMEWRWLSEKLLKGTG
jgi:hypothetical protein